MDTMHVLGSTEAARQEVLRLARSGGDYGLASGMQGKRKKWREPILTAFQMALESGDDDALRNLAGYQITSFFLDPDIDESAPALEAQRLYAELPAGKPAAGWQVISQDESVPITVEVGGFLETRAFLIGIVAERWAETQDDAEAKECWAFMVKCANQRPRDIPRKEDPYGKIVQNAVRDMTTPSQFSGLKSKLVERILGQFAEAANSRVEGAEAANSRVEGAEALMLRICMNGLMRGEASLNDLYQVVDLGIRLPSDCSEGARAYTAQLVSDLASADAELRDFLSSMPGLGFGRNTSPFSGERRNSAEVEYHSLKNATIHFQPANRWYEGDFDPEPFHAQFGEVLETIRAWAADHTDWTLILSMRVGVGYDTKPKLERSAEV